MAQIGDSPRSRGWTAAGAARHAVVRGFPALAGMDPRSGGTSRRCPRIPRARGDGPWRRTARQWMSRDSPRSRGWTRGVHHHAGRRWGFPALAGMDRARPGRGGERRWIPRARGDGPAPSEPRGTPIADSPRSRGWTPWIPDVYLPLLGFPALAGMDPGSIPSRRPAGWIPRARGDGPPSVRLHDLRHTGFPALAGMDPMHLARLQAIDWIPRARGDGPARHACPGSARPDSPRSRGWTAVAAVIGRHGAGFPALAGMDRSRRAARSARRGIPRARGDGPPCRGVRQLRTRDSPRSRGWTRLPRAARRGPGGFPALAGMDPGHDVRLGHGVEDSPRSRGWTHASHHPRYRGRGFPALAGMDPDRSGCARSRRRIPRARGDGPPPPSPRRPSPADSPRSRGWTLVGRAAPQVGRGFPALAGMDPRRSRRSTGRPGIPRARGDGPRYVADGVLHRQDSPRSRGWTRRPRRGLGAGVGFPALAGMDPPRSARHGQPEWIPRARGDGPSIGRVCPCTVEDSPRSRGWTVDGVTQKGQIDGFPALAGMDPMTMTMMTMTTRIPRARGDGPDDDPDVGSDVEDSPRSRGWTRILSGEPRAADGFPALAGMDPVDGPPTAGPARIPRARGDGPGAPERVDAGRLDSPRSRGWTPWGSASLVLDGGFPALAGMDPALLPARRGRPRIPRARGDGPRDAPRVRSLPPDSPRSRGWTPARYVSVSRYPGFPALAGMDPAPAAAVPVGGRIPRARGDGPIRGVSWSDGRRDSPRSRGWTPAAAGRRAAPVGFPALAGMDPSSSPSTGCARRIPRARGDGP